MTGASAGASELARRGTMDDDEDEGTTMNSLYRHCIDSV